MSNTLEHIKVQADLLDGSRELVERTRIVAGALRKVAAEQAKTIDGLSKKLADEQSKNDTVAKTAAERDKAAEKGRIPSDVVRATVRKLAADGHLTTAEADRMAAKIEASPATLCSVVEMLSEQLAKKASELPKAKLVDRAAGRRDADATNPDALLDIGARLSEELGARGRRI